MASDQEILDLDEINLDPGCALMLSADFATKNLVLPLSVVNDDLLVAMVDPSKVQTIAALRRAIDMPVVAYRVDANQLKAYLGKIYGNGRTTLTYNPRDAVSTVDYLLRFARLRHASDVHFDPDRRGMRVRFRVDGELDEVMRISAELAPAVSSRLKIMAELDIAERRAPQDGAFAWRSDEDNGAALDVREATLPVQYGERVTLRLLEPDMRRYTLSGVGFSDDDCRVFENVLRKPHGLVLLTGPTGSGKTTTLYAAVQYLLELRPLNIMTVENPVEYQIPGIMQAQVDGADKVNFSKALRSLLRHDPDVIMIGEIRDAESLDVAVKSALTGHLVLSTLHTNNSVSAVTRMLNMGLEPHLAAATLRLSVAQRLVRSLCPHCREADAMTEEESVMLGRPNMAGETVYRERGCVYCAGKGLRGRSGLFEFFAPDVEMASLIAAGVSETEIYALRRKRGVPELIDDGILKCRMGITTVQEVYRVAGEC